MLVLHDPEFVAEVESNKREILAARGMERRTAAITFQDFVNLVSFAKFESESANEGRLTPVCVSNRKLSAIVQLVILIFIYFCQAGNSFRNGEQKIKK